MKIFLKYIQACVCIYTYKTIIHSAPTYIMKTQTFILDAIYRDQSFDSPNLNVYLV